MNYKIDKTIIDDIQENLDFLSKLFDDKIEELHKVKGGQTERHAYMLYRQYVWNIRDTINDNLVDIKEGKKTKDGL